jgi:exosome complex component RRP42
MVSPAEAHYIIESCFSDFRIDGRSRLEHRPYTVSNRKVGASAPSPSAVDGASPSSLILSNGSSRIHLPGSSTDILCSVKADLVHPSPCKPREGIVELNVDLSLCGSGVGGGMFDGGSGGGSTQQRMNNNTSSSRRKEREAESQITSLLQRLILPHAVNYTQLAILPGRYVWRLSIDIVVLRCDGCILDACSLALREGLYNTKLPCVKSAVMEGVTSYVEGEGFGGNNSGDGSNNKNDLIVDGDIKNAMPPPGVENCPLVVTVSVLSAFVPPPPSSTSDNTASSSSSSSQRRHQPQRRHYISIIDARTEEEVCASSHVCVSIDPYGLVCGVHTLGGSGGVGDSLAADSQKEGVADDNLNDEIMGVSSSSSMPLAMLGDVVASAAMASKNLYSLLNDTGERNGNRTKTNNVVSTVGNDDGNDYGYLLKDHFLIQ